jgi:hypothetical protein
MMGYKRFMVFLLILAAGVAFGGCAEKKKKTRSVHIEGPESEVSVEIETTDKEDKD